MSERENGAGRMPGEEHGAASRQSTLADDQWAVVGDLVCGILRTMLVQQRQQFQAAARQKGCTVEQLTAAAITGAVREFVEDAAPQRPRPR
jgi:hypothetical protein